MKVLTKRGILFILLFILIHNNFCFAGILRLLYPQSTNIYPAILNNKEVPFDTSLPILLSLQKSKKVNLTYEYEDTYQLKREGILLEKVFCSKVNLSFLFPNYKYKEFNFSIGGELKNFRNYLFTDNTLQDTKIEFTGKGYSFGSSITYKNILVGGYIENTTQKGNGYSIELMDKINVLEEANLFSNISQNKYGYQVGYKIKKNIISYAEETSQNTLDFSVFDLDDKFFFPHKVTGSARKIILLSNLTDKISVASFYKEGKKNGYNTFYYNNSPRLGVDILSASYNSYGAGLKKKLSNERVLNLGIETYKGEVYGAGVVNIIGVFFEFIGGYYNYHYDGKVNLVRIRSSYEDKFKKVPFAIDYYLTVGNLNYHFDGVHKTFFGIVERKRVETDKSYNFTIHTLSLNFKKKLKENTSLNLQLIQNIPMIKEKIKKEKLKELKERKGDKIKGGTIYIFSIEYNLQ